MKLLGVLFLVILLYSCSNESNIFNVRKFELSDYDKIFCIDSCKIVNVIDNRLRKDSVIGEVDYNKTPLIINKPLPDYLKMTFNHLICKDTTEAIKYPVTMIIDEFFSPRKNSVFSPHSFLKSSPRIYFKYKFRFEYPYNDKLIRLIVKDSIEVTSDEIEIQRSIIEYSINLASKLFLYYKSQNDPIDTTVWRYNQSDLKKWKSDTGFVELKTSDFFIWDPIYFSNVYNIGYRFSRKIINSYNISYVELRKQKSNYNYVLNLNGNHFETGLGYEIGYANIVNHKNNGNMISIALPAIYKLHLSEINTGLFVQFTMALSLALERINNGKYNKVYFGGTSEQLIGYNISHSFGLSAGIFESGFINSDLLSSDIGFLISTRFSF